MFDIQYLIDRYHQLKFVFFTLTLLSYLFFNCVYAYESSMPLTELTQQLHNKKIALISIDVEIAEIKSNYVKDANQKWSAYARENIITILNLFLSGSGNELPMLNKPDSGIDRQTRQLIALQSIINLSILGHIQTPLPSKTGFKWSGGVQMSRLKQHVDADLGLFLYIRGGFSTVSNTAEFQAGFVSLVNLDNGETIWFDHHTRIAGDLRNPAKAISSMQILMRNFPVNSSWLK